MNKVIYINSKNQSLINVTTYEAKNPVSVLIICSATGVKQNFIASSRNICKSTTLQ